MTAARPSGLPLAEQLALITDQVRSSAPEIATQTDRLVARLRAADVGARAPRPGDELPPFTLPRDDGRLVFSEDLVGPGPLVLSLNRGHWCPYCVAELESLEAIRPEIAAEGGRIVAVLPEHPRYLRDLRDRGVRFDLLTDVDCAYALELSLAIWVGEDLFDILSTAGVFGVRPLNSGFLPVPATFVVGPDGRVASAWTDADFRMRPGPAEILAAVRAARVP
jgi:peroxiredoxin